MNRVRVRDGMVAALPTVLGYASIGLACGIVSANSGISTLEIGLMSLVVYAGSAQFVMCAMLASGASLLSIAITIFLVNLRNFLLGLHTATIFQDNSLISNIAIGTLLTDESYSILLQERLNHSDVSPNWMYGNNIASYVSWVLFTVLGNMLGGLITNPEQLGLDFALVAMFVGIFAGQFEAMSQHIPLKKILLLLLSVCVVYIGLAMFVSAYVAVLVSTVAGCFVGVVLDGK